METEAYTPDEVAKLFKISRHTVYELVKRGELKAFKIGNKMRIDYGEVIRFKKNKETPSISHEQPVHSLSITGSHDFLLESLVKYVTSQSNFLAIRPSFIGSVEGLMMLYRGACDIAAIHLLDPASQEYNLPFIKQLFIHDPITVIRVASREQGLLVAKGNPKNIHCLKDLTNNSRFVNRQKGSGTRFLFDSLLAKERIHPLQIHGYHDEEWTHLHTAIKVKQGEADAGMGIRSAVIKLNLDFIPLAEEQFDLVLRWTEQNKAAIQHFLDLIQFTSFIQEFGNTEGYKTEDFGKVIYSYQ
ncbi:substrate-binding domain-containing protein [Robertmurraya korlensis]|uniref:substrate-binding domain-containing protein n=1 Tax=Robertmurraya korlensis TaxID=519977 RepID=UPI000826F830|nr:helix-turn-helix transcriptional regulator [Robertmurraya korlensis]